MRAIFLSLCVTANSCFASVECRLILRDCPEKFDGITVTVPMETKELAPVIPYCLPSIGIKSVQPGSIVLVIDDSPSMLYNDSTGARYSVSREMLDVIYASQPKTRIGVVVFTNRLAWDTRDGDSIFSAIAGSPYHDAYIPLMRLDSVVTGGKTALQVIKELLQADLGNRCATRTGQQTERTPSSPLGGGTDIALALSAAKDAMRLHPAIWGKDKQSIIFISDGLPQDVDRERTAAQWDFVQGAGMPATFTLYFSRRSSAPDSLIAMTQNIRTNGYSASNARSNLWNIAAPSSELMSILRDSILPNIFSTAAVKPFSAAVMGISTSRYAANAFTFTTPFSLAAATTTLEFELKFAYVDTTQNRTGVVQGDTTIRSRFTIVRSDQGLFAGLPAGIGYDCDTLVPPPPPFAVILSVTKNPFTPGIDAPHQGIPGLEGFRGTVIIIKPDNAIDSLRQLLAVKEAWADIYDAVGNLIAKRAKAKVIEKAAYIPWDGRNPNGRIVGGGTYLAVVKFIDNYGKQHAMQVKLGVKRS